ncbi:M23 family metallopeptidase, partial [bacterium]|nr:M23 family metallopeptidase [bacterium]
MRIKHFAFILALLPGLARAEEPAYHWPLDARPALTSTFGEYRNSRFHAGIDLKTWGQEGFPAFAVDDGSVIRVRTSPWGYGRAVYLKLRDGRTALYAHLSAFAPPIAERVETEQERRGAYSVDLSLKEGEIPVKRGQVMGFSGSSGVGMPHLHFELRDEAERPVNALEHGFSVADSIPPTIRALALIPLDASALVNDGRDPYPFKVQWDQGRGRYLSPGKVLVSGPIGVASDIFDQADASASENRLAPYRLRLLADDAMAFEVTYSGFSYSENHLVDLDRNFVLARRGAGRFHNLYRARGNRLPLYGGYREGDGVLHAGVASDGHGIPLKPGPHLLHVVAEDIQGNRSEAEIEVLVNAPPEARGGGLRWISWENVFGMNAQAWDADGDSLNVVFERSVDEGETWRTDLQTQVASGTEVDSGDRRQEEHLPTRDLIYRMRATDPWGLEASRTYAPFRISVVDTATFVCTPTTYPDFALIRVETDRILRTAPQVTVTWPNARSDTLVVRETGLRSCEVVVPFDSTVSGDVTVTVLGHRPPTGSESRTLPLPRQTKEGWKIM